MTKRRRTIGLLLLCCTVTGCIELRDDIFHGQPPWESKRFGGVIGLSTIQTALGEVCKTSMAPDKKVGLSKLAQQVLGEDVRVLPSTTYTISRSAHNPAEDLEEFPLAEALAKDAVMAAMVRSLVGEYEKLGVAARCKGKKREPVKQLPNTWLWRSEFKEFGQKVVDTLWKESYFEDVFPFIAETDEKKVRLGELLKFYLMEYYGGEYVDRYGTKYSKPQVDFSITNEVMVAIVNILLEAIDDYSLVDLGGELKDPIVYHWESNKITYFNKTHSEPTFARFLRKTLAKPANANDPPNPLSGVLEPVVANGQATGLTRQEVCLIHYLAGLSGEASEGLTGMIVRTLGGSNIGAPVALGKFSIGDNQTVAKLIDAAVETQTKRLADALFSHVFHVVAYKTDYTLTDPQKGKDIDWDWLAKHLKISEMLTCVTRKAESKDPT